MKTYAISHSAKYDFSSNEFEEAVYASTLNYSLKHLKVAVTISPEILKEALQKSLQICSLAGINSKHHFKQIYVFDTSSGTLHIDWLMSKKGFNLMMMQIPFLNERKARWLWQLADL
jgi:hypothetical protein